MQTGTSVLTGGQLFWLVSRARLFFGDIEMCDDTKGKLLVKPKNEAKEPKAIWKSSLTHLGTNESHGDTRTYINPHK